MAKKNTNINPVAAAAVTGAVVGAGVAIAGTIAMKDKKNRTKVKKFLNDAKEQVEDQGSKTAKKVAKRITAPKKK